MRLYKESRGFLFAFGFDPLERKPDPRHIAWADPETGEWAPTTNNLAGSMHLAFDINPQFVRETNEGVLLCYQPGLCLELTYLGLPLAWSKRVLRPENEQYVCEGVQR